MPKQVTSLKPSTVANAKGGASVHPVTGAQIDPAKPYKLADGEGLFLLVKPNGGKLWRLKYRRPVTGAENLLSFGAFPAVGLKEARDKRREARELLAAGIDPSEARKAENEAKAEEVTAAQNTFEAAARDWMASQKVAEVTLRKARWILETFLFPEIGSLPPSNAS